MGELWPFMYKCNKCGAVTHMKTLIPENEINILFGGVGPCDGCIKLENIPDSGSIVELEKLCDYIYIGVWEE